MSTSNEQPPSSAPRERDTTEPPRLPESPCGVKKGVPLETVIRLVTERVMAELLTQGVRIEFGAGSSGAQPRVIFGEPGTAPPRSERVDMSAYKTPVLTERHILRLHALTTAVIVPRGTVVSPKAKELLRDRKIKLCNE